jgi:hypothetical protein
VQYLCSCLPGRCSLALLVVVRLLVGGGSVAVVVLCSLASVSPSCCFGAVVVLSGSVVVVVLSGSVVVVVLCSSRFGAVHQYLCSLCSLVVAVRLLRCLPDLLTRPPNSYSHLAVSQSQNPASLLSTCRLWCSGFQRYVFNVYLSQVNVAYL